MILTLTLGLEELGVAGGPGLGRRIVEPREALLLILHYTAAQVLGFYLLPLAHYHLWEGDSCEPILQGGNLSNLTKVTLLGSSETEVQSG